MQCKKCKKEIKKEWKLCPYCGEKIIISTEDRLQEIEEKLNKLLQLKVEESLKELEVPLEPEEMVKMPREVYKRMAQHPIPEPNLRRLPEKPHIKRRRKTKLKVYAEKCKDYIEKKKVLKPGEILDICGIAGKTAVQIRKILSRSHDVIKIKRGKRYYFYKKGYEPTGGIVPKQGYTTKIEQYIEQCNEHLQKHKQLDRHALYKIVGNTHGGTLVAVRRRLEQLPNVEVMQVGKRGLLYHLKGYEPQAYEEMITRREKQPRKKYKKGAFAEFKSKRVKYYLSQNIPYLAACNMANMDWMQLKKQQIKVPILPIKEEPKEVSQTDLEDLNYEMVKQIVERCINNKEIGYTDVQDLFTETDWQYTFLERFMQKVNIIEKLFKLTGRFILIDQNRLRYNARVGNQQNC